MIWSHWLRASMLRSPQTSTCGQLTATPHCAQTLFRPQNAHATARDVYTTATSFRTNDDKKFFGRALARFSIRATSSSSRPLPRRPLPHPLRTGTPAAAEGTAGTAPHVSERDDGQVRGARVW